MLILHFTSEGNRILVDFSNSLITLTVYVRSRAFVIANRTNLKVYRSAVMLPPVRKALLIAICCLLSRLTGLLRPTA